MKSILSKYKKTFKFNIKNQNVFFVSDPHFGHANIIKYCSRPFANVKEMGEKIIENWNLVVGEKDIVIILGDFCFGGVKQWVYLLERLNGVKYLVPGNHDKSFDSDEVSGFFEEILPDMNIMIQGDDEMDEDQRITVKHYCMLTWYQSHRGSWMLHGHSHGGLSNKGRTVPGITFNHLDCGVDVHDFFPISYGRVKEIITLQHMEGKNFVGV